ncbi:N-acetyltransferase [Phaeodactylibacter luteus]|uniref:GNAT family N-acetyltransferase n=1 Tax=Phaeodactylibacter luteus TaxID=1564516 RepID=A0A5C6RL62_9BACT|nr:hypothetical protein [Phaeodactylibacter luteus]TXB63141.1 hypothetical protein FRY97_10815 [Phaeodactylibacter luteus]
MEIRIVDSPADWELFHKVPFRVYKGDPRWIAPLQGDVESVFDPAKNDTFKNGEASCFVLVDGSGVPVGRIAAFIDGERNRGAKLATGGIGFFECMPQQEYAEALFEVAENWLKDRGIALVDGPINFGEREKFWGLLVQGFEPPLFQENYQPKYYQGLFESNGYVPYEQILTFKGNTGQLPYSRLQSVVDRLGRKIHIETRTLDYSRLPEYTRDFCTIYNASFSKKLHFKPLEPQQVMQILNEAKPIADTDLMALTYFDGAPAAFCALLPDINHLLRFANGRLAWYKLPRLLWKKWSARQLPIKGIGFGVHPDFQNKGAFPAIIAQMAKPRIFKRYKDLYLTTVRAHNEEAVSAYKKLGVEVDRIHIAYRKPLVASARVEPYPFTEPWK